MKNTGVNLALLRNGKVVATYSYPVNIQLLVTFQVGFFHIKMFGDTNPILIARDLTILPTFEEAFDYYTAHINYLNNDGLVVNKEEEINTSKSNM